MVASVPQNLIIPVETLNREFDAKLLLGMLACGRGWDPIIGGQTLLQNRLAQLPRSIYLSKGMRAGNRTRFSLLRKLGHIIVAWDEESLIQPADEITHMMFDPETFNLPRLLFAWGQKNAESWRRYTDYRGTPIIEVGNPRADMLRPELRDYCADDVARLHERFGKFVLFSSNFSLVNHYIPNHVRFRVAKHVTQGEAHEVRDEIVAHKAVLFEQFQKLIPEIANAIHPVNLVVRPHPSENHDTWHELLDGVDNIHIVHEGPIAPWLMAASALVHNSCTSAVEAAVIGTPAFSYRPVTLDSYEHELPNAVSSCFARMDRFVDAVRTAVEAPDKVKGLSAKQKQLLGSSIASLSGPLSCERILDALDDHKEALTTTPNQLRRTMGILSHHKRLVVRKFTTASRFNKSSRFYTNHKFPGISLSDVEARMARFRKVRPDLPDVEAELLSDSVFRLRVGDAAAVPLRAAS